MNIWRNYTILCRLFFIRILRLNLIQKKAMLIVTLVMSLAFQSEAQSFEISSDVCDSLSPTSYLMHVSGYATFTDSMEMTIELRTADSSSTIVYTGSKDFGIGGANTLTNFTFDPLTELFTLEIGTYSSRNYNIHIISEENGELKEELILDTF